MFGTKKRLSEKHSPLTDMHCHILPGLDDGAKDEGTAKQMIDIAYKEGIRTIVFTPHVREPWMDMSLNDISKAFVEIREYASFKYPKMKLYLGAEIYFRRELIEDHPEKLRTMNSTDYLLVEFSTRSSFKDLVSGVEMLIQDGYIPVIAHIERYACLWQEEGRIERLYKMGAYLQVNADTIIAKHDRKFRKRLHGLLKNELIHFVATDAHDLEDRRPKMQEAYQYIADLCGEDYAIRTCNDNAEKMLQGILL